MDIGNFQSIIGQLDFVVGQWKVVVVCLPQRKTKAVENSRSFERNAMSKRQCRLLPSLGCG